MIIASALAVLGAIQTPAIVTFSAPAAPATSVVTALAAQENLKLDASAQMAREFIVVHVESVPLQTLLDKIAIATSGEWQPDGDTMRLVPSTVARNREVQEERTNRLKALRADIAARVKAAQSASSGTESEDDEPFSLDRRGASVETILASLDLAPISQMNPGDRLVFSSSPTAMQRRLPATAMPVIQAMVKEHNRISATQAAGDSTSQEVMDKMPEFVKKMIEARMKPVKSIGKVLLVLSSPEIGMDLTTVELRIYDAEGNLALSEPTSLGETASRRVAAQVAENAAAPQKDAKGTPITYSKESEELLAGISGGMGSGMQTSISDALRTKLARPDERDPLSYMATDELVSVAKMKHKGLVANVSDDLMETINMIIGNKMTVEDVVSNLKGGDQQTLSETEGWVIIRPARPIQTRQNRMDRSGLAVLMRAVQAKGMPGLDDLADFSLTSPSPMGNGVGQFYGAYLVPGLLAQGMTGSGDWNSLRFYGTLNPVQRQSIRQGGTMTIGQMSPAQRNLWTQMVYGANAQISPGEPTADLDPIANVLTTASMMGMSSGTAAQEPTEIMPNGIPGAAVVQFQSMNEPFASPVGDGKQSPMAAVGVLGPTELAVFRLFSEDPNMAMLSGMMPQLGEVKLGERTVIGMNLLLPGPNFIGKTLYDNKLGTGAPVALSNLPPDFQAAVDKRLVALKASPLGSISGLLGAFGSQSGGQP